MKNTTWGDWEISIARNYFTNQEYLHIENRKTGHTFMFDGDNEWLAVGSDWPKDSEDSLAVAAKELGIAEQTLRSLLDKNGSIDTPGTTGRAYYKSIARAACSFVRDVLDATAGIK